MNINASSAASQVAGTSLAAAKGGETDKQATDATAKQSVSDRPAGKAAEASAVDAGVETGDRGGDGRQVLDTFERHGDKRHEEETDATSNEKSTPAIKTDGHLDFEA